MNVTRSSLESSSWTAGFLVVLQFVSAALLVLTGNEMPQHPLLIAIAAVGALMGIWAWTTMGLRRISIMPRVNERTRFVSTGPYCWIRHPMYTATGLFCGAFALAPFAFWKLPLWLVLIGVLITKGRIEERSMASRFADYDDYRARTWRFIPWIY